MHPVHLQLICFFSLSDLGYTLTPAVKVVTHTRWRFLSYSLADTGGIHLEEGVVHEEVESFLFPGTPGVLVPTEAAQQLDAGPVAGGVMSTARRNRKNLKHVYGQLQLIFIFRASLHFILISNMKRSHLFIHLTFHVFHLHTSILYNVKQCFILSQSQSTMRCKFKMLQFLPSIQRKLKQYKASPHLWLRRQGTTQCIILTSSGITLSFSSLQNTMSNR